MLEMADSLATEFVDPAAEECKLIWTTFCSLVKLTIDIIIGSANLFSWPLALRTSNQNNQMLTSMCRFKSFQQISGQLSCFGLGMIFVFIYLFVCLFCDRVNRSPETPQWKFEATGTSRRRWISHVLPKCDTWMFPSLLMCMPILTLYYLDAFWRKKWIKQGYCKWVCLSVCPSVPLSCCSVS